MFPVGPAVIDYLCDLLHPPKTLFCSFSKNLTIGGLNVLNQYQYQTSLFDQPYLSLTFTDLFCKKYIKENLFCV